MRYDESMPKLDAYLAPPEFADDLATELGRKNIPILGRFGRLFWVEHLGPIHLAWAESYWPEAERIPFTSISEAAKLLRARGRNWDHYAESLFRRTQLIQASLPKQKSKKITFLETLPTANLGGFSLLSANELLASQRIQPALRISDFSFAENRVDPPSRAYLKLWELFTIHMPPPKPDELCLDLGASPGGWTWVLAELGCRVRSIDKAPLAPSLAKNPKIEFWKGSAFSLSPKEAGPVDWLFSDVICYPDRLWKYVDSWLSSGLAKNLVITIKFQGKTDFATMEAFQSVPGSKLVHLRHNKHELTWFLSTR
jgi:23S rRNA (cytidine2498-2'-O)-methyltransferase